VFKVTGRKRGGEADAHPGPAGQDGPEQGLRITDEGTESRKKIISRNNFFLRWHEKALGRSEVLGAVGVRCDVLGLVGPTV
jgi:hypothetical protein